MKRIQREVASERGGILTRDHSDYDTLVIRGLRIAQKFQQRRSEEFKELPDQLISAEMMKDVVNCVSKKVFKAAESKRDYSVIQYLSALSDYSDSNFDYKENEQAYNKIIREAYKNLSVRQAFTPFMLIMGDERAQNSRKLSLKLMKEFSSVYSKAIKEASTH